MDEEKFHITQFLLSESPDIRGILKHRSTDFVVEEVDEDGQVVVFDPECIYADDSLTTVKKVQEPKEEAPLSTKSDEDILKELTALFEDENFASSVLEMSKTGSPAQLVTDKPIDDKDHRTRLHLYFKATFPGRLVTDTVNGCFRISLKTRQGGARPATYDHRNNQSANDPRP